MKRHSRAQLLVSMANKKNIIQEDTVHSTQSHINNSNIPLEDAENNTLTAFDDTAFVTEKSNIISDFASLVDPFLSEHYNKYPATTINESFATETPRTFSEMALNNTFEMETTMISETTMIHEFVTEPLTNSGIILMDLDCQGSEVSNVELARPLEETLIVPDSVPSQLEEPNLYQIESDVVLPMTAEHIDFSYSETTTQVEHHNDRSGEIEALPNPESTSSRELILNPETGMFEEDSSLRSQVTETDNNTEDNLMSIKDTRKRNQVLRVLGKQYDGLKKTGETKTKAKKPGRQLKAVPCSHGSIPFSERSFLCGSVNEQMRKDIFEYFWSLTTWEAKKAYVMGSVTVRKVLRRRKKPESDAENDENTNQKSIGIDCFFSNEHGVKVRVCRDMFAATLNICKDTLNEWIKASQTNDSAEEAVPVRTQITQPEVKILQSDSVLKWLDQLAKVPSHYCRSSSSRTYVDEALHSKTQMHKEYVSWCKERSMQFVQRKRFCDILESKKISIFRPRKDQCDTCVSFKEGNISEEEHQAHLLKKNEAREAKKRAITSLSEQHLVFTVDLQSVQLCPKLLVSSQYYKQKLQLHIFTIYVNNSKDVYLFAWHEGEGGVTANEFVTCIVTFIELYASQRFKKVTMISDGCGYQNRNKVLSSALADLSRLKSVEILQIILEKGHTMMEVDSVHSTLEKCFTPPLYSPADYITCARKARPRQPYVIRYVNHTFFKNYEANPSNFASIRPGKKIGDPTVADIRSLSYKNGETFYKLRHDDTEWKLLPQRRKIDLYEEPQCLYTEKRKIEKSKFDSLQSLKPFMHSDYHLFYDSLST